MSWPSTVNLAFNGFTVAVPTRRKSPLLLILVLIVALPR